MKIRTDFVTNSSSYSSAEVVIDNPVLLEILQRYKDMGFDFGIFQIGIRDKEITEEDNGDYPKIMGLTKTPALFYPGLSEINFNNCPSTLEKVLENIIQALGFVCGNEDNCEELSNELDQKEDDILAGYRKIYWKVVEDDNENASTYGFIGDLKTVKKYLYDNEKGEEYNFITIAEFIHKGKNIKDGDILYEILKVKKNINCETHQQSNVTTKFGTSNSVNIVIQNPVLVEIFKKYIDMGTFNLALVDFTINKAEGNIEGKDSNNTPTFSVKQSERKWFLEEYSRLKHVVPSIFDHINNYPEMVQDGIKYERMNDEMKSRVKVIQTSYLKVLWENTTITDEPDSTLKYGYTGKLSIKDTFYFSRDESESRTCIVIAEEPYDDRFVRGEILENNYDLYREEI